jgi:hypothetical protein
VADVDSEEAIAIYSIYMASLTDGPYPLNPVRAWPIVILFSLLLGVPFMLFGRRIVPGAESTTRPQEGSV